MLKLSQAGPNKLDKYIGQIKKSKFPNYFKGKPYELQVDGARYVNLGTGCEKTLMFHFKGEPLSKWEIAKFFK
jgi:hypothetical protein